MLRGWSLDASLQEPDLVADNRWTSRVGSHRVLDPLVRTGIRGEGLEGLQDLKVSHVRAARQKPLAVVLDSGVEATEVSDSLHQNPERLGGVRFAALDDPPRLD